MATTQVTGPYPIFTDLDGTPLDDGYLYIGEINEDPETNPILVFWDANLTIAASQPIRTTNGYAWRNGTPGLIYTGGPFSITIRNKREEFVLYSPVGYGFDPAAVSASVVQNDFVGDGVTVNFTLSASPSTKLATSVFINGVYQEKGSYSLSGNVLTFTIAPPITSDIEVMTNETGVIGSTNASLVSYTAGFAGAVAQTVQTKLEQNVSVKDFGAVGDGVTNASSAFTAALTASKSISIPSGDYLLSSSVTTDAPVVINGLDADSSLLTGGLVIDSTQTRYGYVLNVNLDGPNTGTGIGLTVDETHRMKFDGVTAREYLNGAEFNYAYLNVLINCEFAFNGTGALFKNFTNGTTAYSCTFANNTNHGATVKSSQKFMFHGCDFENNTNYGIVVDSADNGTLQNLNGTVDSCYFENNASDVIVGSGANATKTSGWVFKDNCHLGNKVYGYLVDYASSTKIIRPDFTGAIFSAAAISLTANSENTTIIPFISAQVQAAAGATVSIQTVQTGSVDIALDGAGFGDATITFPIQYFVVPAVNLTLYSNANPSGSLGTVSIKNGIGVTGVFIEVHGGPASTTVKVAWQAGS